MSTGAFEKKLSLAASALCAFLLFAGGHCAFAQQAKSEAAKKPLDLNSATIEELKTLPGIGKTTAEAIVRFREKSGPFRRVEDLLAIRGITKKKLEALRPLVTVKPPADSRPEKISPR
jgi:competence ComEA-like helix-hairpin-helix protein